MEGNNHQPNDQPHQEANRPDTKPDVNDSDLEAELLNPSALRLSNTRNDLHSAHARVTLGHWAVQRKLESALGVKAPLLIPQAEYYRIRNLQALDQQDKEILPLSSSQKISSEYRLTELIVERQEKQMEHHDALRSMVTPLQTRSEILEVLELERMRGDSMAEVRYFTGVHKQSITEYIKENGHGPEPSLNTDVSHPSSESTPDQADSSDTGD